MLGMMTLPHSIPVYKAVGQTLRLYVGYDSVNGFIWNPDVDISPYVPIGQTGYFPTPLSGSYASPGTTTYFDPPTQQYVNLPWLMRCNRKDGEATIDISGFNLTPYVGTDVGSTPYKIRVTDNSSGREAWGFIGAAGGGPAETEMLTGWTESVQGSYDFDVFTTSGSTITKMEIVDTLGKDGLAYTNNFTLVEGHRYRLTVNVVHTGGFHYYPDLYLGVPETAGRLLKDDLLETENRIEFVADASDATQTCIWLYLGGKSEWSDCTFEMKDITGPVTGDELFTSWSASGGYSKSNAITFVEGRKYRVYTNYSSFVSTIYMRMGTVDAMDGRAIGYLAADYPNYFEFTASAADVTGGRVWIQTEDVGISGALSLKELTEQNVSLGGAHIVSADGGSTRNWTSATEGFDWNDIRGYQIMTKDAVLLTEKRYRIQVKDKISGNWRRGYLGDAGSDTHTHKTIIAITKANPGVVTFSGSPNNREGVLMYVYGMSQMTELNGKYITLGKSVVDNSNFEITDTSSYGSAETTGGEIMFIQEPPSTGLMVHAGPMIAWTGWEDYESWAEEVVPFKFNRTDYEVYITLER